MDGRPLEGCVMQAMGRGVGRCLSSFFESKPFSSRGRDVIANCFEKGKGAKLQSTALFHLHGSITPLLLLRVSSFVLARARRHWNVTCGTGETLLACVFRWVGFATLKGKLELVSDGKNSSASRCKVRFDGILTCRGAGLCRD